MPFDSEAPLRGSPLAFARLAWFTVVGLSLVLLVALVPLHLRGVTQDWQVGRSYPAVAQFLSQQAYASYVLALRYAVLLVFLATAALIFRRKPADRMAMLTSAILVALPLGFGMGGNTEALYLYPRSWGLALAAVQALLGTLGGPVGLLALLYLFPDGRFATAWMRRVAVVTGLPLLALSVIMAIGAVASNFYGARDTPNPEWGEYVWGLWIVFLMSLMFVALLGQVHRYRHLSSPLQRQQTKLVILGLASVPLSFLIGTGLFALAEGTRYAPLATLVGLHLNTLSLTLIPLSMGVSILRHRLWGIDLVLNRALVVGGLTAAVVVLYVVMVGSLGLVFQASGSVLVSILATGLIAVLFNPLRLNLQAAVNRLMYGERDDPATALARLGQRLEAALVPDAVLPTIVETIAQALKVPYAGIEWTTPDGLPRIATGRPPVSESDLLRLPLVYQSESIGTLLVAPRAPGESFTSADTRLLNDLVRQAAPAVHATRLAADLQRSRERMVTAREEERRRIRRDLHDGLGPTLASQTLKLDTALDLLGTDLPMARLILEELKAQTQATVVDIRRLVYELRPAALDELGLLGALRALIQNHTASPNGVQFGLDAPAELPHLPAAVEVAAYRTVSEAVTNVVRHARARAAWVRLSLDEGRVLELVIEDDGVGLPADAPLHAGVGLTSMRERAVELGGSCDIENRPAGGMRVRSRLPTPSSSHG